MFTQTYTPGHPFHDPREWQGPLNPATPDEAIQAGDLVMARRGPSVRVGVAAEQNKTGRWVDSTGLVLIPKERSGDLWEAWVIQSPGPEPLPTEAPALITNAMDGEGDRAATLVLNADGLWYGTWETSETDDEGLPVYVIATAEPDALLAFTDPDGVEWARDDAAAPWEQQEARA